MANTYFFEPKFILDFVPNENIVNDSRWLCIRRSNLQLANCHKSCANLKKFCYPKTNIYRDPSNFNETPSLSIGLSAFSRNILKATNDYRNDKIINHPIESGNSKISVAISSEE